MQDTDSNPDIRPVGPADRQPWVAPQLVPLEKIANAEKISFNTESGTFSAIS